MKTNEEKNEKRALIHIDFGGIDFEDIFLGSLGTLVIITLALLVIKLAMWIF